MAPKFAALVLQRQVHFYFVIAHQLHNSLRNCWQERQHMLQQQE